MAQNPRAFAENGTTPGVSRPTSAPTWAESLQRVLTAGLILGCVGVIAVCLPEARTPGGEGVAAAEFDNLNPKRRRVAMARMHELRQIRTAGR